MSISYPHPSFYATSIKKTIFKIHILMLLRAFVYASLILPFMFLLLPYFSIDSPPPPNPLHALNLFVVSSAALLHWWRSAPQRHQRCALHPPQVLAQYKRTTTHHREIEERSKSENSIV